MQIPSADLAPAGVEETQGGASQTVAPWGECAGGGGLGAAEGGGGGHEKQQQQAKVEEQLSPETQFQMPQLPSGPFHYILELLSAQDRACSGRLACREAWRHLSGVHHRTAHLSQPLPPHAVPWFERYGPEALKQLTFREKLTRPMSAAAASGSEANLAAVWGLVRQGLHPELLRSEHYSRNLASCTAGEVLVLEGHTHLLPWLLDSGYPVDIDSVLLHAARYCDVAGLQEVQQHMLPFKGWLHDLLVWAAGADSSTEQSVAKMDLLLQQFEAAVGPAFRLPQTAVTAAASTGDLGRLRWMLQRGCDVDSAGNCDNEIDGSRRVLPTPMRHAGLKVVEWLVREAGCQLPDPVPAAEEDDGDANADPDAHYRACLASAAAASGSVAKLQWLRDRGLLLMPPADMRAAACAAAAPGKLETLRYLHEECGAQLSAHVGEAAVRSGDVGTAAWVLQQGGRGLFADRVQVWKAAAESGSVEIV